MPLILPGNVASATADAGYNVANSCRFNSADSADMNRTFGTPTLATKYTISVWIKRSTITTRHQFFKTSGYMYFEFQADDKLHYIDQGTGGDLVTSRLFRDPSAWYHICLRVDNTLGTADDRHKIYVNGTQETSFDDRTNPTQNNSGYAFKADTASYVGSNESTNLYFDGYIAEFVGIDGLALAPTSFGEFDEDSPTIWKPIDVSGLTFGTNGFYLDFEDSANLGNDANGGTDWTENNLAAADQSVDTPTNNFATLNPLDRAETGTAFDLSEGNCRVVCAVDTNAACQSTLAVSSGKWYAEFKVTTVGANLTGGRTSVGVGSRANAQVSGYYYGNTNAPIDSYGKVSWSANYFSNNGTAASYGSTFVDDDIIGVYLDLDNNKLYFSENGTLYSTTGISITAAASTLNGHYHIGVSDASSNDNTTCEANYGGCPAFSISSGNTDDNGYGNFEYSPNITGDSEAKKFYALCTKNLATYG